MSVVDMAQEDGKGGQQCAAPDCGSKAHLDSKFCVVHQEPDSTFSSMNGSSLGNSMFRMTEFSTNHVVARRSQPRSLRSRNPIKVQTTPSPSPREVPRGFQIPDLPKRHGQTQPGSRAEPSAHETNSQPNNSKLHDHGGQGSVPAHDSERHIVPEGNGRMTFFDPPHPVANPSTEEPDQSLLSPAYGKEDVPGATQPPKITNPNLGCSGGPRDRQGPKECYLVDKAQASTKPQPSASILTSPNHAQTINKVNRPPLPTHVHSPLSNSSKASLDSGGAADIESNLDEEPPAAPADSDERNFDSVDQHDTTPTLENSLEPEFDKARTPQIGEESDGSVPMSLATSITPEKPQNNHIQVNNDGSSLQSEDTLVMREVITLPRRKMEARKERMLANFDSDAFDALIYQQSNLPPPRGVKLSTRSPKKRMAPYQDDRLALHTNPEIHGMHRRSKDWYQKKSREIEDRGGRKAWFGKVAERQRYLRAKEAAIEQECREAELAGRIPPRQDPQPRGHKRIHDFGDVPEDELPEIVRNNPAWMKACAWHRETRRRIRAASPPPPSKPSLPEPSQLKQNPELERHMQKAAEEARRFYQEAVKELQPCGGIYGWPP